MRPSLKKNYDIKINVARNRETAIQFAGFHESQKQLPEVFYKKVYLRFLQNLQENKVTLEQVFSCEF